MIACAMIAQPITSSPQNSFTGFVTTQCKSLYSTYQSTVDKINQLPFYQRYFAQAALGVATGLTITFAAVWISTAVGCTLSISIIAFEIFFGASRELFADLFHRHSKSTGSLQYYDAIIAAPLLEELLFRGLLQTTTWLVVRVVTYPFYDKAESERISHLFSTTLTNGLFSLLHLRNYTRIEVAIIQMTVTLVGGLILSELRNDTGSLLPCITNHMTWNAVVLSPVGSALFKPLFFLYYRTLGYLLVR